MEFAAFARLHGLMIDTVVVGRWVRVPTDDHPRKRNGAYKYLGDHAFVQNHATMPEVVAWRPEATDAPLQINHAAIRAAAEKEHRRIAAGRERAAMRAKEIVSASKLDLHAYHDSKGFKEMSGLVWAAELGAVMTNRKTGEVWPATPGPVLVVPMWVHGQVVGCQLIAVDGEKKFLPGQRCRDAVHTIGQGEPVWCEGYATGLSVHAALQAARIRRSVVVCFSAFNMQQLATQSGKGFVVADNDESGTGQAAAKATGLPVFLPEKSGDDFNDFYKRVGLFKASQTLRAAILRSAANRDAPERMT